MLYVSPPVRKCRALLWTKVLILAVTNNCYAFRTPFQSIHKSIETRDTSTPTLFLPSASYQEQHSNSFSKLFSKNVETNEKSDPIDHAPCYDSHCSSEPLQSSSDPKELPAGLATQRLNSIQGPTVWSHFGLLGVKNPSIANLGQGFPDWLPPRFALDSLIEAATDESSVSTHQYTRTAGHPKLVKELARVYGIHFGRELDAMSEVAVTVGASQALYLSLQTLIRPGDEVIIFEPFFDLYREQVKLAGGIPVYVPLTYVPYSTQDGGEWILERSSIFSRITSKTRTIILNSPHNPTGKIFSNSEMQYIADATLTAGPDCVVLSDEVYKYIVHAPGSQTTEQQSTRCPGHVHFSSLPGMFERTLTLSSAGKTFSATGWQVGWCVGPEHLVKPIHQILPYVQFCASTVMQEALAKALARADEPYMGFPSYYKYLRSKYTNKRDLLAAALRSSGFQLPDWEISSGGGFFIFARIGDALRDAVPKERIGKENSAAPGGIVRRDWALCEWMAEEKGVLCIPASPFFSEESVEKGLSDDFVRIAFCKQDETINRAVICFANIMGEIQDAHPRDAAINVNRIVDIEKQEEIL